MMQRRYRQAYVAHVVRPFFYDHFARLDRQIVLADLLTALNAGPAAVSDLSAALSAVLACFRQGANSWSSVFTGRRIDRILFTATKADLLHHGSHDRLEAILRLVLERALKRVEFSGARLDVAALAAIRATREATVRQNGDILPCIVGTPEAGEVIGEELFDGETEAAISGRPSRRGAGPRRFDGRHHPPIAVPAAQAQHSAPSDKPGLSPYQARSRPRIPARRPLQMTSTRRPTAFRLPETEDIELEPDLPEPPIVPTQPQPLGLTRSFRWGSVLASAATSLILLWAGFALTGFIEDLFARSVVLGGVALSLAGLIALALLAILLREVIGLIRLNALARSRTMPPEAIAARDAVAAQQALRHLRRLYGRRPELAAALVDLDRHEHDIMDPADRIRIAERDMLSRLDETAGRIITRSSRRVTLTTAVMPAAALDTSCSSRPSISACSGTWRRSMVAARALSGRCGLPGWC